MAKIINKQLQLNFSNFVFDSLSKKRLMKTWSLHIIILITWFSVPVMLFAQYAPPAGQSGTTAIFKDSSAIIGWAAECSIDRGFVNLSDTTVIYNGSNKTNYGSNLYVSGPADEFVVSLGDRGSAVIGFDIPIVNGPGPDFAVFENSFGDSFLELAFVEASSDGLNFVRFPAVSLTQESQQIGTFDTIDATKINNLAGKYRHGYGTPFDLDDISYSSQIDLNHVTFIKVVDAGGCLLAPFATFDSQGHKINDPWPTPFDTGGFDLDAVGVIHNQTESIADDNRATAIAIFPNPVFDRVTIDSRVIEKGILKISNPSGNIIMEKIFSGKTIIDLSSFPTGVFLATFTLNDGACITKKIIKY